MALIKYCFQLLIPHKGKKESFILFLLRKENSLHYFKMSLPVALSAETKYGTESHLFLKTTLNYVGRILGNI